MSFYCPLNALRGCKIRLIFLIIKIMAKEFFGKVIDHNPCCVRSGRPTVIMAGKTATRVIRL